MNDVDQARVCVCAIILHESTPPLIAYSRIDEDIRTYNYSVVCSSYCIKIDKKSHLIFLLITPILIKKSSPQQWEMFRKKRLKHSNTTWQRVRIG